jgi:hypothetical protein
MLLPLFFVRLLFAIVEKNEWSWATEMTASQKNSGTLVFAMSTLSIDFNFCLLTISTENVIYFDRARTSTPLLLEYVPSSRLPILSVVQVQTETRSRRNRC